MPGSKRRVGAALAVLLGASVAAVARTTGASWPQIVWGALGCLASALMASFVQWLVTGGPLRLERRPPRVADRPE